MHPFQVKVDFTETPKCAELFLPGIYCPVRIEMAVPLRTLIKKS